MARTDAFKVEGVIVEVLPNRTYRVELPNGHRLLGFVAGRARSTASQRSVGEKVALEISPYDLSEGRIVGEAQKPA